MWIVNHISTCTVGRISCCRHRLGVNKTSVLGMCNYELTQSEEWSSQKIFQFKQLERRSLKKSRLQRDSNTWPLRYPCDTLPTELWSHTLGARPIYWVHISREEWNDVKYIWNNSYIWTAVVDQSEEWSSQTKMTVNCKSKWHLINTGSQKFHFMRSLLTDCTSDAKTQSSSKCCRISRLSSQTWIIILDIHVPVIQIKITHHWQVPWKWEPWKSGTYFSWQLVALVMFTDI